MDLNDLIKLAGVAKSETPVQEQPQDGMRTLIALVTPEQLNQLQGQAPVEEEGYQNSGDHYDGVAKDYKGTLGSPADLSLRRYLQANGEHVVVDENVYPDHTVEDITEAYAAFKKSAVEESMVPSDEEWSKLLKIPNRKSWEKLVKNEDAPDYNPAKASAGGPGYASMPQQIKLAGDSIWDKEGTNPEMVTVTDYEVVEDGDGMISVTVEHDGPWTIYTDSGFEKEISEMIGTEVEFSEQGMQEDGRAHLEGEVETSESVEVDEPAVDENAFNQAAAAAARAGKAEFEFNGKTYKTKMDKDTAHKLDDDIDMLKALAGLG